MFYEYALEPTAISNWARARYFLDAFGPWKGRFLAEYPGRWRKMVYDALSCPDVERKRIVERLAQMDRRAFSRRKGAVYDPRFGWLQNAQAEHQRRAFTAIIAHGCPSGAGHLLDAEEVDETCPLWRVDPGAMVARDPSAVMQLVDLLLRTSARVVLVDPYFRADQADKSCMLAALCAAFPVRDLPVEVHTSDAKLSYAEQARHAARAFPSVLGPMAHVKLCCWQAREDGPRIHNRYLLTDVGGVKLGDSFERGQTGQHDHLSILDEASRARLWNEFAGPQPAFHPAGPPVLYGGP